jgi:hypothetical protein
MSKKAPFPSGASLPVDRITRQLECQLLEGRSMVALSKAKGWLVRNFTGSLLLGWLVIAVVGCTAIGG